MRKLGGGFGFLILVATLPAKSDPLIPIRVVTTSELGKNRGNRKPGESGLAVPRPAATLQLRDLVRRDRAECPTQYREFHRNLGTRRAAPLRKRTRNGLL
jgi:hypothetical protein